MTITNKINHKIDIREKQYDDYTQEIFELISPIIIGVNEFLFHTSILSDGDELILNTIDPVEDVYIITGFITAPVGTDIQLQDGSIVEINDIQDQFEYRKKFRIQVPSDLIDANDSDEVFEYLVNHAEPKARKRKHLNSLRKDVAASISNDMDEEDMNDILENMDTGVAH